MQLWRIDRHDPSGPLDGLTRNQINTRLMGDMRQQGEAGVSPSHLIG
jgi:hypothetical protein